MKIQSLVLVPLALTLASGPAWANGVGFSLPKAKMLGLDGANSWGGSVQVIAGSFSIGLCEVDLGLDYAFTRDFQTARNYAFFDGLIGAGLPLSLHPVVFVTPGLALHLLPFVASPQAIEAPLLGLEPRLKVGFRPAPKVSVEVGGGYDILPGRGGLATLEVGGVYNF